MLRTFVPRLIISAPYFQHVLIGQVHLHHRWMSTVPSPEATQTDPFKLPTTSEELGKLVRKEYQGDKSTPSPVKIPPTGDWKQDQLDYFGLHYFNVRQEWVEHLICPETTQPLPPGAKAICDSGLGLDSFIQGDHAGGHPFLLLFGNKIAEIRSLGSTESAVDALAGVVMESCNRYSKELVQLDQQMMIEVKVGKELSFNSIPDSLSTMRRQLLKASPVSLVVVEDKRSKGGNAQYQLPGEMLAVAYQNRFSCNIPGDQTIFAIRFKDAQVAFFRAEFSGKYLDSVKDGLPKTPITIFKFGGGFSSTKMGLTLADVGDQRNRAFKLVTSLFDFFFANIYLYWQGEKPQAAPIATQRLQDINQP